MKIKSKRILTVSTIIAFAGLLVSPAFAEDLAEVVATTSVQTTGIINVEHIVVNDNLGTKTSGDFEFTVKHFGTNVEGSPFNITDETGMQFILEPGTYVVSVASVDGYLGTWSGEGVTNGFVNLKAGQEITFVRNTYDNGVAEVVYPIVDPVIPCDPAGPNYQDGTCKFVTEDGGLLPVTGTNWFNAVAIGLLIATVGAFGLRKYSLNK
jgi:LPXTG-motif cell wall-anchored protein